MILMDEQAAELEKNLPPVKFFVAGEKIHAARKAQGITQFKLAEMLGIDYTEMSHIEHGRKLPTADNLLNLEEILGVTRRWIILGDDN